MEQREKIANHSNNSRNKETKLTPKKEPPSPLRGPTSLKGARRDEYGNQQRTEDTTTKNSTNVALGWFIQIESEPKLLEALPDIMACISELGLHAMDHHISHKKVNNNTTTLPNGMRVMNGFYCKDMTEKPTGMRQQKEQQLPEEEWEIQHRIEQIRLSLEMTIHQEPHNLPSHVYVQRWNPQIQQPPSIRQCRTKTKSTPSNLFFGGSRHDMFFDGAVTPSRLTGRWYRAKIVLGGNSDEGDDKSGCFHVKVSKDVVHELQTEENMLGSRSGKCLDRSVLSTYIQPDFSYMHPTCHKGGKQRRRKTRSTPTTFGESRIHDSISTFFESTRNMNDTTPAVIGDDDIGRGRHHRHHHTQIRHRGGCRHKAELTVYHGNGIDGNHNDMFKVLLSDDVVHALKTGFQDEMSRRCRDMSVLCVYIQPDNRSKER